ncbi:MAG: hypothetical protein RLZZ08_1131, partial [Pseudomonadota bacterium]
MNNKIRLLASTALFSIGVAAASPALASPALAGDGNGEGGYIVSGNIQQGNLGPGAATSSTALGRVTQVSNTTFTDYVTAGGAGSGGGGGLGGVFFVDNGATLQLNNVSFVGNTAVGGTGGGIQIVSAAGKALSLTTASADASATPVLYPTMNATWVDGQLMLNSMTLDSPNALIGVGAGVSLSGGPIGATVSTITSGAGGSQVVTFTQPYVLPSSALASGTMTSVINGGTTNTVTVNGTYGGGQIRTGMVVYGDGVPAGTTVTGVNYDGSGNVLSYTVSQPITVFDPNVSGGGQASKSVYLVTANQLDVTRYQAQTTTTLSNVITPTAAISGFAVGMTVNGAGVPDGTVVTGVNSVTGAVTLSNQIDLSQVQSVTASFNPLLSNICSAVLKLDSTANLVVGQQVSGQGIASGTTITSISGNVITLSSAIDPTGVSAINSGTMIVSVDPVMAVNTNAQTITFASVAGLAVGALVTGGGVPANAVITYIDAESRVVSYRIDPSVADLVKGGSMNGLVAAGPAGLNGSNGHVASSFNSQWVNGEGQNGTNGYNAGNGNMAAGGNAGNGGTGSNGSSYNFSLISKATSGPLRVSQAAGQVVAAFSSLAIPLGTFFLGKLATEVTQMVSDIANLASWTTDMNSGLVAFGGDGGAGGVGGAGATFFGGGAGGNGGTGGAGALAITDGGAGGVGGTGGVGGFGAGGGSGGAGGLGGMNGQSLLGADGAGGAAGFGGGVGSSDGVGGGGGSAYGGAIFVRDGGTLYVSGNALFSGNTVLAGSSTNGGTAGDTAGSGLFLMTGSTAYFTPGTGHTITLLDNIADDSVLNIAGSSIATGFGANVHIGGGGTVQFFGENTYTGTTFIEGGTLEAQDGTGINAFSHIQLAGAGTIGTGITPGNAGVWLTDGTVTRRIGSQSTQLSWSGSGGFAAGADGLVLNFGGSLARQSLVWGANGFVSGTNTLVFGSDAVDATGAVTMLNSINLAGQTGRIAVYDNLGGEGDYARITGAITNGRLLVNDTGYEGSLYLTAQNSLSGITVQDGFVSTRFNGTNGRLMAPLDGGSVLVTGGWLELGGNEHLTTVDIGQYGALHALAGIQAGTVNNAGFAGFEGTTQTADVTNTGLLVLNGRTTSLNIWNKVTLPDVGVVSSNALVTADRVLNDGDWYLGADLAAWNGFTNNGNLFVGGNANGTPAERTITTSGFSGGSNGVVDLDGANAPTANRLIINQSGDSTYNGVFTGTGSLTKQGAGWLDLGGANTFTGGLTIAEGAIGTYSGGTLADTLAVTVLHDGLYAVGTADRIGSIVNYGNVDAVRSLAFDTLTNSGYVQVAAGFTSTGLVDNLGTGLLRFMAGSAPVLANLRNSGEIRSEAPLTITGSYEQNAGTLETTANLSSGSLSGAGGTITLNGANVHYSINQTEIANYYGAINGSGVVDKYGPATLVLAGSANSFSPSALNVHAGWVTAAVTNVLDTDLVVTTDVSGGLDLLTNQSIASLTNNNSTFLRANLTTSGLVTNNGYLDLRGTFHDSEFFPATRTINTAGFAGGAAGRVALNDNALIINQSGNSTYAGIVTGAGSLTKQGAGTLTLTGASTFTGGLAIQQGAIDTTGGGTFADTLDVTVADVSRYIVGTADTIRSIDNAGGVTVNAALTLDSLRNTGLVRAYADLATGTVTNVSGTIRASAGFTSTGLVTNQSGGIIRLDATSRPTFASLTNSGTIVAQSALTITGAYQQNAGVLAAYANLLSGTLSGTGGTIQLNGPAVTYSINQTDAGTYSGAVIGSGVVNKFGAGTLTLDGAEHTFSPSALNVQGGWLVAASANVFDTDLAVTTDGDGVLDLSTNQSIASLINNNATGLRADLTASSFVINNDYLAVVGAIADEVETAATRTITTAGFAGGSAGYVALGGQTGVVANQLIINQSGNSSYAGVLAGAGSLVKQGLGTLILTGANTFTGGLAINEGGIDTTGGGTLANTLAVTVGAGGSFVLGTADTIGAVTNAGLFTTNADAVLASLTNTGLTTVNAGFAVTGALNNLVGGVIVFNGNMPRTLGSLTNSGNLTFNSPMTITGAFQQNGGTVTANANLTTGSLSGSGGTIVLNGADVHYAINQTAAGTYSGAITGAGVVDKYGTANLTLDGAQHAFAPSALNVWQGALTAASANVLNDILLVDIDTAGTLALLADQTIESLAGNGTLNVGSHNLTLATGGTFTGQITGTGHVLLASGAFTLTDTGGSRSNTFQVDPGSQLNITQASVVNTTALTVDDGTLNLNGVINATTVNLTNGGVVQLGNGMNLAQQGAQVGSINSTNTYVNGGSVV